jgi:hypothetical protein
LAAAIRLNRGTIPSVLVGRGTADFAPRDDCFYIEVCVGQLFNRLNARE